MLNGNTIEKIRINKGYTQKYVAKDILSQSSYSKFEAELSDVHSIAYINFLDRLDMTLEEVRFINNDFKHGQVQQIINNFFSLPYNDVTALEKIKIEINNALKKHQNILLLDIKLICEALISLNIKNDINIVRIIERLELYDGFQNSQKLIISFKINLTLLLIKEGDFLKALEMLTIIIQKHKKSMSYQSLAVCFARISICNNKLGRTNATTCIQQARLLLKIYDDLDFLVNVEKEYAYYK
ncbi:helix-turn-helix domain-containing protein [Sporosarcina psychrophila]|uniref:helix-turn-helix domain-containing protein n=1 Tax=Sporosarcina psychrophila TaxID=1476 RepID=UPI003BA3889A